MAAGRSSTATANRPTTSCSTAWTTTRCRTTCLATRRRRMPSGIQPDHQQRLGRVRQFQGGIVSATIKSGTNSFHGDVWEFFRNDELNANSWENKFNDLVQAPHCAGTCSAAHSAARSSRTNCSSSLTIRDSVSTILQLRSFHHYVLHDRRAAAAISARFAPAGVQLPSELYNPCATGTAADQNLARLAVCTTASRGPVCQANIIPSSMISPVAAALFASPLYPEDDQRQPAEQRPSGNIAAVNSRSGRHRRSTTGINR